MLDDEVGSLCWGGARQAHDAVAEIGVGFRDCVLGTLGLFPALKALSVSGVDFRPPGREEDGIAIAVLHRSLAQWRR